MPGPPPGPPVPQINDLFVDASGLPWVTGRSGGGRNVLAAGPALAALMERARL